jgi:chaperonin cofactor prefoldin
MPISNDRLLRELQTISQKLDVVMSQQDEIDADVVELNTAAQAILDEIAALQDANPALDLSALKAAADRVAAIAPPAA